ncbi:hypothetical protein Q5H92_01865 [Hymenobacter sp. M29]|uniref:Uncharacterized protein n=1 Tax=Hymenobacter mellowenesis TaxID=3063995 RepID=A0ABT9A5F9_9BACT|nr:hypothetical protein [Hymenobacter sp. M29]MDO7845086.1 hypothetical protein [Hymenobacter sp. M29]
MPSLLLLSTLAAQAQTPTVSLMISALAVSDTAPTFQGQHAAGRPV